jgi:signal recognition particle GTPase
MPAKIFMNLNNNNYTSAQLAAYKAIINAATPKSKAPQGLNASMVGRIHNVKPGCGSCGK